MASPHSHRSVFPTATLALWDEDPDKALKTNSLGPGDVSFTAVCQLPSWDESPCSPVVTDGDPDANPRACVRECSNVCECSQSGNGVAEDRLVENGSPPFKVIGEVFWGM